MGLGEILLSFLVCSLYRSWIYPVFHTYRKISRKIPGYTSKKKHLKGGCIIREGSTNRRGLIRKWMNSLVVKHIGKIFNYCKFFVIYDKISQEYWFKLNFYDLIFITFYTVNIIWEFCFIPDYFLNCEMTFWQISSIIYDAKCLFVYQGCTNRAGCTNTKMYAQGGRTIRRGLLLARGILLEILR